jgi:hypothetical protein
MAAIAMLYRFGETLTSWIWPQRGAAQARQGDASHNGMIWLQRGEQEERCTFANSNIFSMSPTR